MKANELRIGNLVQCYINNELKNDAHVIDSDDIKIFENNLWYDLRPIPLTEEWLLKFGFIKSDFDSDNSWLNLRYRFLNFASDESVNFEKVYLTVNKMDIICSYVHELQNLYFALTQTELTLKP